jgi:hypothetical protein
VALVRALMACEQRYQTASEAVNSMSPQLVFTSASSHPICSSSTYHFIARLGQPFFTRPQDKVHSFPPSC